MKHTPRIFIQQKLSSKKLIMVDKTISHHLINVLRLKPNSPVIIFNGEGGEYRGQVTKANKKATEIQLNDFVETQRDPFLKIELLQSVVRQDKMDWIIQKAVELGVSVITPVLTDYTNIKIDAAKIEKRMAHWKKIIVSATEQCGRCDMATLNPPIKLNEWLSQKKPYDVKLVCHPGSASFDLKKMASAKSVCVLIGPEGGLSEEETHLTAENGFQIYNMGPRILRAETAAVAILAVLQHQFD